MVSDFPEEREEAIEEIIEVISTFPMDFLQKDEGLIIFNFI